MVQIREIIVGQYVIFIIRQEETVMVALEIRLLQPFRSAEVVVGSRRALAICAETVHA